MTPVDHVTPLVEPDASPSDWDEEPGEFPGPGLGGRSYRDVAADERATANSSPGEVMLPVHCSDAQVGDTDHSSAAAVRLKNLRSGRRHGAFRTYDAADEATTRELLPSSERFRCPTEQHQPGPSLSVIRVPTQQQYDAHQPSAAVHAYHGAVVTKGQNSDVHLPLPFTDRSNNHSNGKLSKKRSFSHLSSTDRSVKLETTPSPQPSTSAAGAGSGGSPGTSNSRDRPLTHQQQFARSKTVAPSASAKDQHSPVLPRAPAQTSADSASVNSVTAAGFPAQVPSAAAYVDNEDLEASDSDVDVISPPSPGECYYTSPSLSSQPVDPSHGPGLAAPPSPPPAHSGAHPGPPPLYPCTGHNPDGLDSGWRNRDYNAAGGSSRPFFPPLYAGRAFHREPYESTGGGGQFYSGACNILAAENLTRAAERELQRPVGETPDYPSAAVNLSTKEAPNSDDSDIEVVSIVERKKPRLRGTAARNTSGGGRSATVVVDLTESDNEAGPSATQSRPSEDRSAISLTESEFLEITLDDVLDGSSRTDSSAERSSQEATPVSLAQSLFNTTRSDHALLSDNAEAGPSATLSRPAATATDDDVFVAVTVPDGASAERVMNASTSRGVESQAPSSRRPPAYRPPPPAYDDFIRSVREGMGTTRPAPTRESCQKDAQHPPPPQHHQHHRSASGTHTYHHQDHHYRSHRRECGLSFCENLSLDKLQEENI